MKKVPVASLKAGMAFDKPVYIDSENILVDAFDALKSEDIERLLKWNIHEVETNGNPTQPREKEVFIEPEGPEKDDITEIKKDIINALDKKEHIFDLFTQGSALLNEAYETIAAEKPYQVSRIRNLAEDIATLLHDNPQVFLHIYYMKTDGNLYSHLIRSAFFGAILAAEIQYSQPKIIELAFSILLMDVGMNTLPLSVRSKDGKLNANEKALLHTHPLRGYQLLTQNAKVKNSIAMVALQHQEHFDGSGYPRHVKGAEISEFARIAMIADSFSALLEDKSYRTGKLPYGALKELLSLGIYYYDSDLLRAFLNRLSIYPIGSIVELSNNSIGLVAGVIPEKPMRPIILILRNEKGKRPGQMSFIHLIYRQELYITNPLVAEEAEINMDAEIQALLE